MNKPIRVLYEIHPHTLGGTERFLGRLLPRLDRRLYEPIVISQKAGLPVQSIRSLGLRTETMTDYFKASGIQRLAQFIHRNRIGLVQSNYYSSNLAMAANLAGVPHVWRLGGHVDVGSGVRNARDSRWALDMIRLLSKSIICNSKYVRSQFHDGSNSPPVQVIPNGIPLPDRVYRMRRKGNVSVGMVAHFTPQKRHLDFIRAAELVCDSRDDVSFTILGTSYADSESRSYATKVQRWGRSLQKQGKLTISEFAESEHGILSNFDMIILPSLRESFSNAILESMAAGVPVIAAHSGGHPELIQHRKTGLLVPPMQPKELAKAVLLLVNNSKLIDQMGRDARMRVQTCFSIDACVRKYEAVYSEVISNERLDAKSSS